MSVVSPLHDPILLRRKAEEAAAALDDLVAGAESVPRAALHAGAHARKRAGAGEKFWQYRDYDPADRPQDIDWRQSAKGERVFVRQKEHQAPQAVYLWCAGGPRMAWASQADLPRKDESAQILCLAAGLLLARGGERVGVAGAELRPGHGENTLQKIAQELARTESAKAVNSMHSTDRRSALPGSALADALPAGSYLLAAGDFLDAPEDVARALDSCAIAPGNALIVQILDPAERALPYDGRVLFRDPENGQSVPIENAGGVRAAYRERIEAHIAAIRDLCRRRHWHYILHDTSGPPARTLAQIRAAIGADFLAAGAWSA